MHFASLSSAAVNRTKWKGIVANASVVLEYPYKNTGWNIIE